MKSINKLHLILFLSICATTVQAQVSIFTWSDLNDIRDDLAGDYILENNLDENTSGYSTYASSSSNSGNGWLPIGTSGNRFTGSLDGDGYTISGLFINRDEGEVGLFSTIGTGGTVVNLGLTDVDINTNMGSAGGIASINWGGTISESYVAGGINGYFFTGGIVGSNISSGLIQQCYSTGTIEVDTYNAGGLIGYNDASIENSYSTMSVSADSAAGGLVGSNLVSITSSYAIGEVTGNTHLGGLTGFNSGTISNGFWNTTTSGQGSGIGFDQNSQSTTGLSSINMYDTSNFNGWDFNNNWEILQEISFPYLKENVPFIVPGLKIFGNGNGSAESPLQISTLEQLDEIRNFSGIHFELTSNIDASDTQTMNSGQGWEPIGSENNGFEATLNGNNYSINDLYINRPDSSYLGLFGVIASVGSVKNLTLTNVEITGNDYIGGLAGKSESQSIDSVGVISGEVSGVDFIGGLFGENYYGDVSNSFSKVDVIGSGDHVGGLVGILNATYTGDASIEHSYSTGDVSGATYVGGLVGLSYARVEESFSAGNVTGSGNNIGGLVGYGSNSSTISRTYSTGEITGSSNIGGIIGYNRGTVLWSYAVGKVSGSGTKGGVVGYNQFFYTISENYWNSETTGLNNALGSGAPENDASTNSNSVLMTKESTFSEFSSFDSYWNIIEGLSYPYLSWQENAESFNISPATAPGTLATNVDTSHIQINWNKPEIGSPIGYNIYRDEILLNVDSLISDTTFSDYDLEPGIVYEWHSTSLYLSNGDTIESPVSGTVVNAFAQFTSNEIYSLWLDGIDDYIVVSDDNSLDLTNGFTIEGWVKVKSIGTGFKRIISKTGAYACGFNASQLRFTTYGIKDYDLTYDIPDDSWFHLACVFDNGNDVSFYVDGILAGKVNGISQANTTSDSLVIGSNSFHGQFDEIRLWNSIRKEDEIRSTMFYSLTGLENGLQGYWNFDDTSESIVDDKSSNGNEGIIQGAVHLPNKHPYGAFITGSEGWRLLSSPVDSVSYYSLLKDLWTQGFTGADDESGASNVYTWNEAAQQYQSTTNASATPEAGKGFIVYVFDDVDNDQSADGFPKSLMIQGNQLEEMASPSLSFTDTGDSNNDGWNLVGNPYAFPLNWAAGSGWTHTNIDASFYVWNAGAGEYQSHNGLTGTLPDSIIAPGQGFWVKANAANPSLSLTHDVRSEGGVLLKKKSVPQIKLQFEGGELTSKASIMFSELAELGKDRYDAFKLAPLTETNLTLGTLLDTLGSMDIQALPLEFVQVELGLDIKVSDLNGAFKLNWNLQNLPEAWNVILIDNETGEELNLRESEHYSFELGNKSEVIQSQPDRHADGNKESAQKLLQPQHRVLSPKVLKAKQTRSRFTLILNSSTSVSTDPASELPTFVELEKNYPNPFNPSTTIAYGVPKTGIVTLEVFDILGRKVATLLNAEKKTAGRYTIRFEAHNLASGMYIYRLRSGNIVMTKKLTLIK